MLAKLSGIVSVLWAGALLACLHVPYATAARMPDAMLRQLEGAAVLTSTGFAPPSGLDAVDGFRGGLVSAEGASLGASHLERSAADGELLAKKKKKKKKTRKKKAKTPKLPFCNKCGSTGKSKTEGECIDRKTRTRRRCRLKAKRASKARSFTATAAAATAAATAAAAAEASPAENTTLSTARFYFSAMKDAAAMLRQRRGAYGHGDSDGSEADAAGDDYAADAAGDDDDAYTYEVVQATKRGL